MNHNLFKSTEFYKRRYHNYATLLILPVSFLVIFLVLFSLIAKKEITVTSRGEITPTTIIASIQSTSNNKIQTNHLKENQNIKKGDILLQYYKNLESSQKQTLENQLTVYQRQKAGLEELKSSLEQHQNLFTTEDEFGYQAIFQQFVSQAQDLELGVSKSNAEVANQASIAENTVSAIDQQINDLTQQIEEYRELATAIANHSQELSANNPHQDKLRSYLAQYEVNKDRSITDSYLSQINQTIASLESSMASLNIQRSGIGSPSTYDNSLSTKIESLRNQFLQNASQQLTAIKQQISEVTNQLNPATLQLNQTTIIAPESGVTHLNKEMEGKSIIPAGNEIAQIFPNIQEKNEVLITYYVSSEYLSLLKEGQTARLSLEKVGNQPIVITGKVNHIDKTATRTDQGNLFKIQAKAKLSKKSSLLVHYGIQGRVASVIAKKTYFHYYIDKLLNNKE